MQKHPVGLRSVWDAPSNPFSAIYTQVSMDLYFPGFSRNIVLSVYADDIVVLIQKQKDILANLTDLMFCLL